MAGTKHIYISFSEITEQDKWNKLFIENLQITISRFFKNQPLYSIKGIDFTKNNADVYISQADVFILIFNSDFENDNEYQAELQSICDHLNITADNKKLDNTSRILKIYPVQINYQFEPPAIQDILPFNFFDFNVFNRKSITYNFDDDNSITTWSKLLDLTYVIREIFESQGNNAPGQKLVYIGPTSIDQINNKDEISRELQHFGYRIVPLTKLPDDIDNLKNTIIEYLEGTNLIVQILGSQYGKLVGKSRFSLPDFQNQVIRDYITSNPEKPLQRIVWIPTGMRITDQRQKLFLQKLKRNEISLNTEIVETPIEVFKTILQERLNQQNLQPDKQDKEKSIYLIYEETAKNKAEQYGNEIIKAGYKLLEPNFADQDKIYNDHLNNLKHASYLIIFEAEKNLYWLKSKIRDLIKAPGLGRTKPMNKIYLLTQRRIEAKDLEFIANKLEFVNADLTNFNTFLSKLKHSHDNE